MFHDTILRIKYEILEEKKKGIQNLDRQILAENRRNDKEKDVFRNATQAVKAKCRLLATAMADNKLTHLLVDNDRLYHYVPTTKVSSLLKSYEDELQELEQEIEKIKCAKSEFEAETHVLPLLNKDLIRLNHYIKLRIMFDASCPIPTKPTPPPPPPVCRTAVDLLEALKHSLPVVKAEESVPELPECIHECEPDEIIDILYPSFEKTPTFVPYVFSDSENDDDKASENDDDEA